MDRGVWWSIVHGVTESDMTEHTHAHMHPVIKVTFWKNPLAVCREGMECVGLEQGHQKRGWGHCSWGRKNSLGSPGFGHWLLEAGGRVLGLKGVRGNRKVSMSPAWMIMVPLFEIKIPSFEGKRKTSLWGAIGISRYYATKYQKIVSVVQLCCILCDPMDYSPPGSLSVEFSRQEYWSG